MGKENIKVVSRGKWLLSVEFIQDSSYKYTCSNSLPCIERGARKENRPGVFLSGLLKRIEIPRFMKGLVKSIMCSRTKVIVSGATAERKARVKLLKVW